MNSQKIPATAAKAGMILAEELQDSQGRTILGVGGRLSPLHIKRLQKWGIRELCVEGEDTESASADDDSKGPADSKESNRPQLDEEYMREMAVTFSKRFAESEKKPLMETLKKNAFKFVVLAGRNKIPGVY